MKYYIGIDLGGTNIVSGVVDENFNLIAKASDKTNAGRPAEQIAQTMAETAKAATQKAGISLEQISSVGIGTPGVVDSDNGVVISASNLHFENVPLGSLLSQKLGLPVFVANDADAAAYGEFMAGAGKSETGEHISNMLAITLGTGVGSGIIINSKIYNGYGHAGGEFGHTIIQINGRQCGCGRKGCLDVYCSATGLITTTKEQMQKHPESSMWKRCGGDLDKVEGYYCFDAANEGDEAGKAAVEEYTTVLAEAILNAANTLQPEIICIGGGVSKQGENLLRPIRSYMDRFCLDRYSSKRTQVRIAELGNDAGVIGAALIGLQAE